MLLRVLQGQEPRDRRSPSSLLPWVRGRSEAGATLYSLCGREGTVVWGGRGGWGSGSCTVLQVHGLG